MSRIKKNDIVFCSYNDATRLRKFGVNMKRVHNRVMINTTTGKRKNAYKVIRGKKLLPAHFKQLKDDVYVDR